MNKFAVRGKDTSLYFSEFVTAAREDKALDSFSSSLDSALLIASLTEAVQLAKILKSTYFHSDSDYEVCAVEYTPFRVEDIYPEKPSLLQKIFPCPEKTVFHKPEVKLLGPIWSTAS